MKRFLQHLGIATIGSAILSLILSSVFQSSTIFLYVLAGFILGVLVSTKLRSPSAALVWCLPTLWLLLQILSLHGGFSESWAHTSFYSYIVEMFFSNDC